MRLCTECVLCVCIGKTRTIEYRQHSVRTGALKIRRVPAVLGGAAAALTDDFTFIVQNSERKSLHCAGHVFVIPHRGTAHGFFLILTYILLYFQSSSPTILAIIEPFFPREQYFPQRKKKENVKFCVKHFLHFYKGKLKF